jgi:predicted nucleic acid-binding protein
VYDRDVLLDAGPLIALLNRRDQWHAACAEAWPALAPRCVTTDAVVAEACHVLGARAGERALPLEMLIAQDVPIAALHAPAHRVCAVLMRRYADTPMDYADATLVALGDALGVRRVFTMDRKGFRVYRGARGLPFELLPTAS